MILYSTVHEIKFSPNKKLPWNFTVENIRKVRTEDVEEYIHSNVCKNLYTNKCKLIDVPSYFSHSLQSLMKITYKSCPKEPLFN